MADSLNGSERGEMIATYGVTITGIERTKKELAQLTGAIQSLRKAQYTVGGAGTVSEARFGGGKVIRSIKEDIFIAKIDQLEGRVQSAATQAMASGMAKGKQAQAGTLAAAVTKTGLKRAGKGPGRNKTGTMIEQLATNVETQKVAAVTTILGWHGWGRARAKYFEYQERGTKGRKSAQLPDALKRKTSRKRDDARPGLGVPAANSLGAAIPLVREHLKRELGELKR